MGKKRNSYIDIIRRSLAAFIILLMGVSIARLLVTMHQQEERIEILEASVSQLLADTSRLQIPASQFYSDHRASTSHSDHYSSRPYSSRRRHSSGHQGQYHSSGNAPQSTQTSSWGTSTDSVSQPSPTPQTHKFTSPHVFDLNTIDSLTLIRIPGIASRTAQVILTNRQRYGGFYSPDQLRDFLTWDAAQAYLDEWCTLWFTADANRLRTLPLNTASISQLQRHPYITHEQAVEITRYRTRHKRISTVAEMQQMSSFTSEQLQQLLPYLSFE